MKILFIVVVVLVASACAGPKYTASFNNYDQYVGKSVVKSDVVAEPITELVTNAQTVIEPITISQPEPLLASLSSAPVELISSPEEKVRKTYFQMTKTEQKALRTHIRTEIKTYVKEQKKNLGVASTQANAAMDDDLKLASIFGVVGIVAMIIGGDVFYIIGSLALIVGVVFFVKWLVRQ